MSKSGPAFPPDSYVVRYGGLGALRGLGGLLGCGALIGYVVLDPRSDVGVVIGLLFAVCLFAIFVGELRKATRREVAFAVHRGGVYFGSEATKDDVPWSRICAVELFLETVTGNKYSSTHRCVGVRATGTSQPFRLGNGPAAQPLADRAIQYYIDAGRPELLPGVDGTIRYAYRRMTGWRVNPAQLAAAVGQFAPTVPVIDGPNFPPQLTRADAMNARRTQRGRQ